MQLAFIDVTDRKQVEIKSELCGRKSVSFIITLPRGYHSIGPDGPFVRINDTELKWLGYEREEIIGRINCRIC